MKLKEVTKKEVYFINDDVNNYMRLGEDEWYCDDTYDNWVLLTERYDELEDAFHENINSKEDNKEL